jgi:hypothetical protein
LWCEIWYYIITERNTPIQTDRKEQFKVSQEIKNNISRYGHAYGRIYRYQSTGKDADGNELVARYPIYHMTEHGRRRTVERTADYYDLWEYGYIKY